MSKWITRHKGILGLLLLAVMAFGIPASLGLVWVQNMGILSADAVVFASDAPAIDRLMATAMKGAYGARIQVCDGTADQTEINAGIGACPSVGGKVLFTSGNFYDNAPISITASQITLEGHGASTILRAADNLNDNIIEIETSAQRYNCAVRNLRINGNAAGQASGNGISWAGVMNGLIENVYITNVKDDGIYANAQALGAATSVSTRVTGCQISSCGSDGMYLRYIYAWVIDGNPYINATSCGVFLSSCGDLTIANNAMDQCAYGIKIYDAWRVKIVGNRYIGLCSSHGILLDGTSATSTYDIVIASNGIAQNTSTGIYVNKGEKITIEGNHISKSGSVAQPTGIYLGASCSNVRVANNVLDSTTTQVGGTGIPACSIAGNIGYLAPAETRTYAVKLTAGSENATTYWQNPFAQAVWVSEVTLNLTTAASASNPTYDIKIDTDGAGVPDGTAFLDGSPDTVGTYWSWTNAYGGAATGVQVAYVTLASNASTSDWIGLCIEDAAGADSAGIFYVTLMGQ